MCLRGWLLSVAEPAWLRALHYRLLDPERAARAPAACAGIPGSGGFKHGHLHGIPVLLQIQMNQDGEYVQFRRKI